MLPLGVGRRLIIFSSVVAHVSLGLQRPLDKKNTTQGTADSWSVLREAFQEDKVLKFEACDSAEYEEYFNSLPPLELDDLRIPSGVNILFYGHSFLHQILNNILAANSDVLIKNGPFGGLEGIRFLEIEPDGDYEFAGYKTRWEFKALGSSITEIQNVYALQTVENIDSDDGLKAFLNTSHFDVAFFMNPHPRCYWENTCPDEKGNPTQGALRDSYTQTGDYVGDRSDVQALWEAIEEAVNGNAYEVEAWCSIKRTNFHADKQHLIRTVSLARRACNQLDSCSDAHSLDGHQCQPGRLAFVSEAVVAKMYEAMT